MSSETSPSWQIAAANELKREHKPSLRASASGHCERRLAYAAQGAPESNPPDEAAQNIMALGNMAEILIIQSLHNRGWETDHTVLSPNGQLELEINIPGAGQTITGHPDGICRHPQLTRGQWVTLECKSMSLSRSIEVQEQGIALTYPQYMNQIALYAQRLYDMNLVSNPHRGVFAMMNRNGETIPPERTSWTQELHDETIAKLADVIQAARTGNLPDRPYPSTAIECKFCAYHSTCWGQPPIPGELNRAPHHRLVIEDDENVVEAARTYAALKTELDHAKDTLREACRQAGNTDIESEGLIAGWFIPRADPVYDHRLLRSRVPAELLRQCAIPQDQPEPVFWIRSKNR